MAEEALDSVSIRGTPVTIDQNLFPLSLSQNFFNAVAPPKTLDNTSVHSIKHTEQRGTISSRSLPSLPIETLTINAHPSSRNPHVHDSTKCIEYTIQYMEKLRSLVASKLALENTGYILQRLSTDVIEAKKRCSRCKKRLVRRRSNCARTKKNEEHLLCRDEKDNCAKLGKNGHPTKKESGFLMDSPENINKDIRSMLPNLQPSTLCRFHADVVTHKVWSCCRGHISSSPCQVADCHRPPTYHPGELENYWKFYPTPSGHLSSQIRPAIAIDCEMGIAKSGESELIRMTVIDYFSSEVLVDKMVYPDVVMEHYNTRSSGVTRKEMEMARAAGRCLMGKKEARETGWSFVGPDTIVVGHSAHNDLTAMRWIHKVVIDTWLIESSAKAGAKQLGQDQDVPPVEHKQINNVKGVDESQQHKAHSKKNGNVPGPLSLKTLTWNRLGRKIQTTGRKGHDSLEDAIVTRDLTHWNVLRLEDGSL